MSLVSLCCYVLLRSPCGLLDRRTGASSSVANVTICCRQGTHSRPRVVHFFVHDCRILNMRKVTYDFISNNVQNRTYLRTKLYITPRMFEILHSYRYKKVHNPGVCSKSPPGACIVTSRQYERCPAPRRHATLRPAPPPLALVDQRRCHSRFNVGLRGASS